MAAKRINFTKVAIEALTAPPKGATILYDTHVKSLCIRVSYTGHKSFFVCKKINGSTCRITIGSFPDISIEQARAKGQELCSRIARGEDPVKEKRARETLTLGEAFELYLNDYAKQRCKTWEEMAACFKRYLSHWSNRRLSSLTRHDIQSLVNKLGNERGCTTANRTVELLRAIINKMKSWDFFKADNPANSISKFRRVSRSRFLQTDEVPKFFAALSEESPLNRDYILLCLLTGARKSRVQEMHWDQINMDAATWRIPGELEKNGQEHTVPLVPKAIDILKERKRVSDSEWVFPSKSKTGHLVSPHIAWSRVIKRAGLNDLHLHDLRRTLGSWQAAAGADLAVIGRTLNHKDISTTLIYARLNLDPVRQSMESATSALLNAAVQPKQKEQEKESETTEHRPLRIVKRHRRLAGA